MREGGGVLIPSPWEWALLALAAFRLWKLLGDDDITERPRAWIIGDSDTRETLFHCPWCLGAWVSLAWMAAFWLTPHWTLVAAVPFAVSAAVGFVATVVTALQEA